LRPLERDLDTQMLRRQVLDEGVPYEWIRVERRSDVTEFVVGRIPGIGLHLGMSRGLYAAWARLHQAQAEVPGDKPLFPADPVLRRRGEDEEGEEMSREARRTFYEREEERLETTKRDMARAYVTQEVPPELLRAAYPLVERPESRGGLLEARTAETYVAVEPTDPVLARGR